MHRVGIAFIVCSMALLIAPVLLFAEDFDPYLSSKANEYQDYIEQWHTPDLGGLVSVQFTDETRQEAACLWYQGDSTIWTGMYLASQALRYKVTGDLDSRAEVIRIVGYFHNLMQITDTLGYIGRYAGHDVMPINCQCDGDWKVLGTGGWEGYFWIDHTSRDQYSGYFLGMSLAYDAVDDSDMRAIIRQDLSDVIEMLENNSFNITDENGEWTGNHASWVGPLMRLSWILQTAYVTDDPHHWQLLDEQYQKMKPFLWVDAFAGVNKYSEYFGNNLRHNAFLPIFRFWPDRKRLNELFDIWLSANRPWVKNTLNPWFDAVHVAGCLRLDRCDQDELDSINADSYHTLQLYWDPPSWQRAVTCSDMPLDPFSVWADQVLHNFPWLENIINIDPQTKDPREITDRHWTDMYWQSTPFEASCSNGENKAFTGNGMDYLLAYWIGVYYGILPGNGPYGDDDPIDDDSADDDSSDDDTGNDDSGGDDQIDDDSSSDDDLANDDIASDDDSNPATSDDDDSGNKGCGC